MWNIFGRPILATHSGSFHPDDVFCVALLSVLYNKKIKVVFLLATKNVVWSGPEEQLALSNKSKNFFALFI